MNACQHLCNEFERDKLQEKPLGRQHDRQQEEKEEEREKDEVEEKKGTPWCHKLRVIAIVEVRTIPILKKMAGVVVMGVKKRVKMLAKETPLSLKQTVGAMSLLHTPLQCLRVRMEVTVGIREAVMTKSLVPMPE